MAVILSTALFGLLVCLARTAQAIQCYATTTSRTDALQEPTFGTYAFPQVADIFTVPQDPTSYTSCISYTVAGSLVVTSGPQVIFTVAVAGIDGQGTLNTCQELKNPDGNWSRTADMYSVTRYRPAQITNFACCETDFCNTNNITGLTMVFSSRFNAASIPMTSSVMIMLSAIIGFCLMSRMV